MSEISSFRSKLIRIACSCLMAFALMPVLGCWTGNSLVQKTYRNPILAGRDIADPDVLQIGDKYFLYGTTDGHGYEVFVSQNLVDWKSKGIAFHDPRHGAWAPDLFHNKRGDGKFYLYYTDSAPRTESGEKRKQIGVAVADSPLGPFIDKGTLAVGCIDAHLFQDDDGKLYLYYVEIEGGFKIFAQEMETPLKPKGDRIEIIHPTEPWEMASGHVTEGPFMLKRDGVYYMMYSGSGADSMFYAIGYATSKSPLGPFVKYAGNPIARGGGNVIGPGHHCVVEGPDKKLWMLYHQKKTPDISWPRFLALDPLWFDEQGVIHATVSHGTEQPASNREK
ncbi:MAG: glycoside hydrolase family 43 protein [Verrucomicrobiota bacterium]